MYLPFCRPPAPGLVPLWPPGPCPIPQPARQPVRPAGLRRRWPEGPIHAAGGLPVYGAENPFQYGAAVIDPGELFFRAGNPIGAPVESFRGVSASRFPFYAAELGPGAPLSAWLVRIAGAPLSMKPAL